MHCAHYILPTIDTQNNAYYNRLAMPVVYLYSTYVINDMCEIATGMSCAIQSIIDTIKQKKNILNTLTM